jgi:hypothetical protein
MCACMHACVCVYCVIEVSRLVCCKFCVYLCVCSCVRACVRVCALHNRGVKVGVLCICVDVCVLHL